MKIAKKIFSLVLTLISMISITPCIMADNDDGVWNIISEYYMPGGEGVGFHDTADVSDPMEKKPEYWGHGGIILRPGEWIKYELSEEMKKGTYTLYVNMANYNENQVSVSVNDSMAYHYVNVPASTGPNGEFDGSLMYYTQREIGDVYIGGENNTLTLKACKDAFTFLDFTLVYKNGNEAYTIAHSGLYSCVNNGTSGTDNLSEPEIGYISGSGADVLPNKMLVMRPKSRFTFDISHFSEGTYALSVKSASLQSQNVNLILSENADGTGKKSTTGAVIPATGSWNTIAQSEVLPEIFIADGINYLTIDVVSNSSQLDYLIFEKVSDRCERHELRYNEVTSDVAGEGFYAGKVDGVERESFEAPINGESSTTAAGMRAGYFMEYDISCLPGGEYTLSIIGATYLEDTAVDVYVNDGLITSGAVLGKTGAYSELLNYTEINVPCLITLNEGINTIKIKAVSYAFNLRAVVLSAKEKTAPSVNVFANGDDKAAEVTEGTMKATATLGDFYDGKETMLVFVIYRRDDMGRVQIYKTALQKSDALSDFTVEIDGIELEEDYSYYHKVFLLKTLNYSGYVY